MTKGEGLGDAYTETLSRIQAQPRSWSKLGMEVLMWVSHAQRSLHVNELRHALGVEASTDLDIRNIPAMQTLLACTMGLVTVEKSSSTVRLVHYTLQEYLSNNINLFPNPHSIIAEVCLTYLNFPQVRSFSPTLSSLPPTAPFVNYASCYWGTHVRLETTESVKTLALKLLYGYDKHISSKVLLLYSVRAEERPFGVYGAPRGFTGLHGAAYFGCLELAVTLLESNKGDMHATDCRGNTALAWASKRGHEGMVRALLEWDDVNSHTTSTKYSSTPLLWAAEFGHEGVVRILLERNNINPNRQDRQGRTPLSWASMSGREGVVRMLLERNDVNPDKPNNLGQTPLHFASSSGYEGVVRMLLERDDVNPDKPDKWCQTPFHFACENGHEGVIRMLLEQNDFNPDKPNKWGLTPFSVACKGGQEGVVRMLLERNDVNPDKLDKWCQTPLHWACQNGHDAVVRMLLGRNDVNPDKPEKWGETPLHFASHNGHEGIVRMLLERNDVNPEKPDKWCQTPLHWACQNGQEGVVRMLLERNDVNPDKPDKWCLTPLHWACESGHEGVVSSEPKRPVRPSSGLDGTDGGRPVMPGTDG